MRKLLLIPLAVLFTVLVSCGYSTTRQVRDDICYEKTRDWILGQQINTAEYPVKRELCP